MTLKTNRVCQPCTACCDGWVQIKVKGCEAYPGRPCPHSTGSGCDDYHNRPVDPCRKFECAWVKEGSYLPDDFRPDQCGALVIDNVLQWQGMDVDLAVPVGREIPLETLNWLKSYAEQKMRPLIYQQQPANRRKLVKNPLTLAHGPPAFQEWLQQKLESGEKLW
ncbi:hypothetical protein [Thiomicrorhabdus xiamenensis]|uniref:Uncharacterized protein n=1 Tax=Thiomicrorhabdus xiamenensis TaxID=2739063 RepID=A0A7D4SS84_9GAMM|nr:hypothetical protein [Thiomicrorhabdus xiamenensis]QKI89103.1 hypothetical protein HQN79_05725 [Thiomicrorhabdus xiamenensis]